MSKKRYKEGDVVLYIPSGNKYKIESIDDRWTVLVKLPMVDDNYWTIPYRGRLDNNENYKLVKEATNGKEE